MTLLSAESRRRVRLPSNKKGCLLRGFENWTQAVGAVEGRGYAQGERETSGVTGVAESGPSFFWSMRRNPGSGGRKSLSV